MGQGHAYLDSLDNVEYVVLRPTWFMGMFRLRGKTKVKQPTDELQENLLEDPQLSWIKSQNKIYSATGNGKIPFIAADDIARVAFYALTNWKPQKVEYLVLGPELFSYDQVY